MAQNHTSTTHELLVSRIPATTGRPLEDWLRQLDEGPSLLRSHERVQWLRMEHQLSHGYATAIVHEHVLRRAHRSFV